jgi:hypothetical protein
MLEFLKTSTLLDMLQVFFRGVFLAYSVGLGFSFM